MCSFRCRPRKLPSLTAKPVASCPSSSRYPSLLSRTCTILYHTSRHRPPHMSYRKSILDITLRFCYTNQSRSSRCRLQSFLNHPRERSHLRQVSRYPLHEKPSLTPECYCTPQHEHEVRLCSYSSPQHENRNQLPCFHPPRRASKHRMR